MRRIHSTGRERAGFTIVELLVVIGIIAVLAAISAGAYFRVVSNQYIKETETRVRKVATGLDGQWSAVIADVQNEISNGKATILVGSCGNDRDAANAIYLKLRLRQEFPQSFAEVNDPSSTTRPATFGVIPKQVYVQATTGITGNSPTTESAILLYLALTQTRRGATFKAADVGGGSVGTVTYGSPGATATFPVFIDAWGTPIYFERWSTAPNLGQSILLGELSEPPYAQADQAAHNSSNFKDTQDPYGKVINNAIANAIAASLQLPNYSIPNLANSSPNYAPVIYSLGPDKAINTTDDILSFRLKVAGQKGN
jgi:prepilin-type N-terminal cleavage/methylation domain-containing protein